MKVALDISPLESGHKVRGVGSYVKHLKEALRTYVPENVYQFFKNRQEVTSTDLIHYPYFEPFAPSLPLFSRYPTIITIHDLTPIVFPREFEVGVKGKLLWKRNRVLARRASAIITDSNASKKDIVKLIGISEKKVHVVYLAAGEEFGVHPLSPARRKELTDKYQLPKTFVLYVGDVTANKNLPRLLRAVKLIGAELVLVGKAIAQKEFDRNHPWNKDLVTVQKLAAENEMIHILGFVPDEDLNDIYNLATVFAMPSLYEGFGLPVLEAMQAGCPVVTSRGGSLPEVAGDAAVYVDAMDESSVAQGLEKVLSSSDLRQELSKKSLARAKHFSWKKTAEQTATIYKSIAS